MPVQGSPWLDCGPQAFHLRPGISSGPSHAPPPACAKIGWAGIWAEPSDAGTVDAGRGWVPTRSRAEVCTYLSGQLGEKELRASRQRQRGSRSSLGTWINQTLRIHALSEQFTEKKVYRTLQVDFQCSPESFSLEFWLKSPERGGQSSGSCLFRRKLWGRLQDYCGKFKY